jgi:hypothetical protein
VVKIPVAQFLCGHHVISELQNGFMRMAALFTGKAHQQGGNMIATGYAEEVRGAGNVNRTSHVENCETSAIGRALANCGMAGSDMSKRPSREEMAKVQRTSNGPAVERGTDSRMPSVTVTQPAGLATEKQVFFASSFYKKDGREAPKNWLMTLTSKEMSALIDDLKAGNFPEPSTDEEPF